MKISLIAFLLSLIFQGSLGAFLTTCNNERCLSLFPQEEIFGLGKFPTGGQVLALCPRVLETIDCALEEIQVCTGKRLEELVSSSNRSAYVTANFIINGRRLAHDLCNQDSDLYKNYDANIECFSDFYLKDLNKKCQDAAKGRFEAYHINTTEEEKESDAYWEERECLTTAYSAVCLAKELKEKCGVQAQDTFKEIFFRRMKILQLSICESRDFLTLQTEFINFLEQQGENRDLWTPVLQ